MFAKKIQPDPKEKPVHSITNKQVLLKQLVATAKVYLLVGDAMHRFFLGISKGSGKGKLKHKQTLADMD